MPPCATQSTFYGLRGVGCVLCDLHAQSRLPPKKPYLTRLLAVAALLIRRCSGRCGVFRGVGRLWRLLETPRLPHLSLEIRFLTEQPPCARQAATVDPEPPPGYMKLTGRND